MTNPCSLCRSLPLIFQATYVTSLFPYVILIILFGRGITLEGAGQGYLKPDWKRLASATVRLLTEVLYVIAMSNFFWSTCQDCSSRNPKSAGKSNFLKIIIYHHRKRIRSNVITVD